MQYGTANFSRCGNYRYLLTRSSKESQPNPCVTFVMLNPAKADALKNDQTIGKCIGFAERWGMKTLRVVNLYSYCTSFQEELFSQADPVGRENQKWLREVLRTSNRVVCAWGKGASAEKVLAFNKLAEKYKLKLYCIGTNQDGSPKHPARIGYASELVRFEIT